MSKQSKILGHPNTFKICITSKARSHTGLPSSAEKGQSFYEQQDGQKNLKRKKAKEEDEFYLPYREKRHENNFLTFYRMKSLLFFVNQLTASELKGFKVMGTMDKKIAIAFHEKLQIFCFFDQHAMHERIRYEYYLECLSSYDQQNSKRKEWNKSVIEKNGKEMNVISEIKHSYMSFKISKELDSEFLQNVIFRRYGFEIQYSKAEMTLKVTKVPKIMERAMDHKLILGIAHDIISKKPSQLPKCLESIIAEVSCKSAYKFNDIIQIEIINELIQNLSLCQYPFFCVHGRPTLFTRV